MTRLPWAAAVAGSVRTAFFLRLPDLISWYGLLAIIIGLLFWLHLHSPPPPPPLKGKCGKLYYVCGSGESQDCYGINRRHRSCVWVLPPQISHPCLLSIALVQFGVNTDHTYQFLFINNGNTLDIFYFVPNKLECTRKNLAMCNSHFVNSYSYLPLILIACIWQSLIYIYIYIYK